MYERTEGAKYERGVDAAEITKRMRKDIKAAVKAEFLPAGIKVSVRLQRYSGGKSIDIKVTHCPVPFLNLARLEWELRNPNKPPFLPAGHVALYRYNEEGRHILMILQKLHDEYNFYTADTHNVNYYGDIRFDWDQEKRTRDMAKEIINAPKPKHKVRCIGPAAIG